MTALPTKEPAIPVIMVLMNPPFFYVHDLPGDPAGYYTYN